MPARTRHALLAAAGFAAAAAITGIAAFDWPLARAHDAKILGGFRALAFSSRLDTVANWIATAATPVPYVLLGAACVLVALARRRRALALAVPVAMAAASASTELLKQLGHVRYAAVLGAYDQISGASWPSGHATAVMMIALGAVAVSPPLLRPLVALMGSGLAIAVSYSLLILALHYPSDVLGGFLVAGTWMSVTLAALWWFEQRLGAPPTDVEARPSARAATAPAALGAAALVAAVAVLLALSTRVQVTGSLVTGAATLAIVAMAMTGGLVVALLPRDRARPEGARGSADGLPAAAATER